MVTTATTEQGDIMMNKCFDLLRAQFRRRSFVANRADPTQVTRWVFAGGGVGVELTASWGVEARVTVAGWGVRRTWRTYDNRFFVFVFDGLEAAHDRYAAQFDEDPMGRAADYI